MSPVQCSDRQFVHHACPVDASVGEHAVGRSQFVHAGSHRGFDVGLDRDVAADRERTARSKPSCLFGRGVRAVQVDVEDCHPRSLLGGEERRSLSDPRPASGYEDGSVSHGPPLQLGFTNGGGFPSASSVRPRRVGSKTMRTSLATK